MTAQPAAVRTIGPYEVLYEIGRGGMGVVYRAVRTGSAEVALKMPSAEMSDYFGSMRREMHALSRLRHPGVVRILDQGVENGVPWYAMELLDARPLGEVLRVECNPYDDTLAAWPALTASGSLPAVLPAARPHVREDLPRALTLMYRLARVLAYIHAHGIVHRDLKFENVLVRAGDRPVLVDFGLMAQFQALSGRDVLEVGGLALGTMLYISPEQARGELVDARADLYSFGVMLYELVTGRPLFNSTLASELLLMHVTQNPRAPSELVDGVPPVLEELIMNLLQKQRSARLGYATDVAERLVAAGAEPDPDDDGGAASYLYRPDIIGRAATIDSICNLLPHARKGAGAFLLLGGVSGIGKTSVAARVARQAAIDRFTVVAAECDPVAGQPLHPLRPLFAEIADYCRGRRDVTRRVLGDHLPVLREFDPGLAALAGESTPRIPPAVANRRLFTDLAETLAAFARERPLLLVLDDLQWADEITLRFLATLGRDYFDGLPLVILGTYRAEEAGPDLQALRARDGVTTVMLDRLDDDSIGDVVRSMLATPDAPASFLEFLSTQTEGNPFFIAEYLRAAVGEGLLYREHGRWHIAVQNERYATLPLPGKIRDLVVRRLDRLSLVARRVAEGASVLGREVREAQLIAACGQSEADTREGVAELIAQHVCESTGEGIRFAHDKLRETAYARIGEERRRMLHARAAELIETSCEGEQQLLIRHAAELARHCDAAGLRDKAIPYYAMAAESAVASGACREGVELMNRAIALDEKRPAKATRSRHARWHRVLAFAEFGLGDMSATGEHARQSFAELGFRLPQRDAGWRLRLLGEAVRQAAHFVVPARFLRPSPERQLMLRDLAMAARKLAEASYYNDQGLIMLGASLLAVNWAERAGDPVELTHAYANFGGAIASGLGLRRLARYYFRKARALALETGDQAGLAFLGYVSVGLYITTCDWAACVACQDESLAAAEQIGDHNLVEAIQQGRGLREIYTGRLSESVRTFTAMRDRARKRWNRQHEAWGTSARSLALVLLDRCDEALASADASLELLRPLGPPAMLVTQSHRCLALMHLGRYDEAVAAADAAMGMLSPVRGLLFEKYRGLSATAEVYLDACARTGEGAERTRMRRAADMLLRRLGAVTRTMPVARPVLLRLHAFRAMLDGDARRGEKLLRKSTALAARLALPIDEGIGEYELSRLAALDDAERREHRERARAIFTDIGCDLYLRKIAATA